MLAVAALVGLYAAPSARGGLLLALLGSSTVLYHQIAGYSLAVLLAVVASLFLPYLLLRDRSRGVYLSLSLALLGTLLRGLRLGHLRPAAAWWRGCSAGRRRGGAGRPWRWRSGPSRRTALGHFLMTTTRSPCSGSVCSASRSSLAGETEREGARRSAPGALTLLVWTLLLFFGSLTSCSGFPDRFERDLGVPLAIFAALALVTLLRHRFGSGAGRSARTSGGEPRGHRPRGGPRGAQSVQNLVEAAGPSARPKDRPAPGRGRGRRALARGAQRRRKHRRDPVPGLRPQPCDARDGRLHQRCSPTTRPV